MVQLGGLEPPTSCSTDRRSNQLSYSCIGEPRGKLRATFRGCKRGLLAGGLKNKEPGLSPGSLRRQIAGGSIYAVKLHCTFMVFDMLALIGSAVSVATFWASVERVFAWAESDSNCLRIWLAESSTASASVFEPNSSLV
jgi:hypothetical protein